MSDLDSRPTVSSLAARRWDVVVVGGGITGAGVVRELARLGARALLVERGDFACGTSSRSSKLIHGGLHYLARFEIGLARSACREREKLVAAGGDLVRPVPFVLPVSRGDRMGRVKLGLALTAYGALTGESFLPQRIRRKALERRLPGLAPDMMGGFVYRDAVTDDAALVLRVIREACDLGARVVNYVEAAHLIRGVRGDVVGITVRDRVSGDLAEVRARAVVNATGPWGDGLRRNLGLRSRIRWVRGSHLVLARPISGENAVVSLHPDTGRPFYLVPWGGRTLVGSTHVEQDVSAPGDRRLDEAEVAYLARGLAHLFPGRHVGVGEVVSTFSGIRPIVDRKTRDPARASREHALWVEDGLLTVTGGKLTTFQPMAFEVIDGLRHRLPRIPAPSRSHPPLASLEPLPPDLPLDPGSALRVQHRHGTGAVRRLGRLPAAELRPLGGLGVCPGMLRWIVRHEAVIHLDDLLLRRLRIGLTVHDGGCSRLPELRTHVQPGLGWSDLRWKEEAARYRRLWRESYAPPGAPSRVTAASKS